MTQIQTRCPHGLQKPYCRDCGGSQTCEHTTNRAQCKKCSGGQVCEHEKIRHRCKECGGKGICEHGVIRIQCRKCGGSQVCEHDRMRHSCSRCKPKGAYRRCGYNAKHRKISFDISLEDFKMVVSGSCIYCGESEEPMTCDRIDNTKGYSVFNCQPCCHMCNSMKSDFQEDEFDKHLGKIHQYRSKMETTL